MTRNQVKVIINLLKSKDLEYRPAIQKIFVQDGYMWASDGYIALEIGEFSGDYTDKCCTLNHLKEWYATHSKKTDMLSTDDFVKNEDNTPAMTQLLHVEFEPATEIKLDIDKLKQCCDFLGIKKFSLEQATKNKHLYRIKPLDDLDIIISAMGSKAYIMGLK